MHLLREVHFIATPIGDLEDMTLRGIRLLREAEVVIVEEYKRGKKLLDLLKIDVSQKELIALNEHNERYEARAILERLLLKAEKVCLISDGGHPAIADSGHIFLRCCLEYDIEVKYVPGASSILGALLVSGFSNPDFYYWGFLPRKTEARNKALRQLKSVRSTLIILETAYRLDPLLKSLKKVFPPGLKLCLAFNLTHKNESVFRGTLAQAVTHYRDKKNRHNFVLIINNGK